MQIMIDLETLSSAPDAAIVAIGATTFLSDGPPEKFYAVVDPKSAQNAGGHIDARTVQWWAKQAPEARAVLNEQSESIEQALYKFALFAGKFENSCIWGNGASFDNVILRNSYTRIGMIAPWQWRNDRCYRTLKNLRLDVPFEAIGVAHHALDDAISQAIHAERILSTFGGGNS